MKSSKPIRQIQLKHNVPLSCKIHASSFAVVIKSDNERSKTEIWSSVIIYYNSKPTLLVSMTRPLLTPCVDYKFSLRDDNIVF